MKEAGAESSFFCLIVSQPLRRKAVQSCVCTYLSNIRSTPYGSPVWFELHTSCLRHFRHDGREDAFERASDSGGTTIYVDPLQINLRGSLFRRCAGVTLTRFPDLRAS